MTSVLVFSQDLRPKKIVFDNEQGIFIGLDLMDTITFKLIERKGLISEFDTTKKILTNSESKVLVLSEKNETLTSTANKWKTLYEKTEEQNSIYQDNLELTEALVKSERKRGRKRALYAFGGGVTIGVVIFAVLIN